MYQNKLNGILNENHKNTETFSQILSLSDQHVKEIDNSEKVMRTELCNTMSHIREALSELEKFLLNNISSSSDAKRRTYLDAKHAAENVYFLSRQV